MVSVARSDYGLYHPVLTLLAEAAELELRLFVSGMHLAAEFGNTIEDIEADGFPIAERVEMLEEGDSAEATARSMGRGLAGFAEAFTRSRPDLLLVLGDRFEMFAAVAAALPARIPVAHLHGGETSEGAMDEAFRHSITKMSHIHMVATEAYRRRVIQLGEEPWRVSVTGAPGLDNIRSLDRLSRRDLETRLDLDLSQPPLLVTFHPTTLSGQDPGWQARELIAALRAANRPTVITFPNADSGARAIISEIEAFAASSPNVVAVRNLGSQAYLSLMSEAAAMVGNSSSGIIEAASFELPVVDIGDRQRGRLHGSNVIHTGHARQEIGAGIDQALGAEFRASLAGIENPYGDGHAAPRIVERLREVEINDDLLLKRFHSVTVE